METYLISGRAFAPPLTIQTPNAKRRARLTESLLQEAGFRGDDTGHFKTALELLHARHQIADKVFTCIRLDPKNPGELDHIRDTFSFVRLRRKSVALQKLAIRVRALRDSCPTPLLENLHSCVRDTSVLVAVVTRIWGEQRACGLPFHPLQTVTFHKDTQKCTIARIKKGNPQLGRTLGKGIFGSVSTTDIPNTVLKLMTPRNEREWGLFEYEAAFNVLFGQFADLQTLQLVRTRSSFSILMPEVKSGTIRAGISEITPSSLRQMLRKVLHTLLIFERLGVVHHDLKSDNIMLNGTILDFGKVKSSGTPIDPCAAIYIHPTYAHEREKKRTSGGCFGDSYSHPVARTELDTWAFGCMLFKQIRRHPLSDYSGINVRTEHQGFVAANRLYIQRSEFRGILESKDFILAGIDVKPLILDLLEPHADAALSVGELLRKHKPLLEGEEGS